MGEVPKLQKIQSECSKGSANLQAAGRMYLMAFEVKKQKFSLKFPDLTPSEIHEMTVRYFVNLPKD